jgi:hypothetical protein
MPDKKEHRRRKAMHSVFPTSSRMISQVGFQNSDHGRLLLEILESAYNPED